MKDRIAIVTGGAGGIGLACVERLTRDGARVVLADVNHEDGARQAERLGATFIAGDLADPHACHQLVDDTVRALGGVDILINNAGFQHVAAIEQFPDETWERMLTVMLTAPFRLTRDCWPHMKARRWGRIVNIASIHGLVASPFKAGYTAAKHGLIGLTRAAALEGGAHGITVNAVCPAYVRTPLVERQIEDQARVHGMTRDEVVATIMLAPAAIGRLIEPDEVAGYVAYLCSDAAASITGAAVTMDLGWTAR